MSDERWAVVTGANRGIGFGLARALANRGFSVFLTARDEGKAQEAAKSLQNEGLPVNPAQLDVASDASAEAFFARLGDRRVDVLINNAGIAADKGYKGGPSMLVPVERGLEAFNTNAAGAWRMILGVLPGMNARGYGRIVNVSSDMGSLTDMGSHWPAYRISKAALNAVTRIFRHETQGDVKINSVCPGWVQTDMGGARAPRTVEQGVASILWAVTLPADGPNGGFFRDGKPLDW